MRAIYLIARREYLSYVATWGFWISLLSVPLFLGLAASIPFLITNSQPVRYYVILDETGQGLDQIVQTGLEQERRQKARAALEALDILGAEEGTLNEALAVFDEDPDGISKLDEALAIMGVPESAESFAAGLGNRIRVQAPGQDSESLRPYLTGSATIDTPQGPRGLFGALIISEGEDKPLELTWYSTNLTDQSIANEAYTILTRFLRRGLLTDQGFSADDIERLNTIGPDIINLDPAERDAESAVVTNADRAPYLLSLLLAFILWTSIFSIANMLLTGLIEEKGGKIIEVLLSCARFHEILIGKLAGVAAVSFTLFGMWGMVGLFFSLLGGQVISVMNPEFADVLSGFNQPTLFLAAFFYFVMGYLMFGAIFLAMGSLCETLQDAQSLMSPVILMLMAPLLIITFSLQAMDSLVVQAVSWIPLWTPFIMMARLPTNPPLWEIIGTTTVMVFTTAFVLWGAAAVFRQGALSQADADSVRRFFRLKGRAFKGD